MRLDAGLGAQFVTIFFNPVTVFCTGIIVSWLIKIWLSVVFCIMHDENNTGSHKNPHLHDSNNRPHFGYISTKPTSFIGINMV